VSYSKLLVVLNGGLANEAYVRKNEIYTRKLMENFLFYLPFQGNLKQHMLTHKIRDMEQETFRNRAVKYVSLPVIPIPSCPYPIKDLSCFVLFFQMGFTSYFKFAFLALFCFLD